MSKWREPVLVKSVNGWELLYTYGTYFYIRKEGTYTHVQIHLHDDVKFFKVRSMALKMFDSFIEAMVN